MNKKLLLLGVAPLSVATLLWGPTASAACSSDGSESTGADHTVDPAVPVYSGGDASTTPPQGYLGVGDGESGYIELGGDNGSVVEGEGAAESGQYTAVKNNGEVCNDNID